MTFLVQAHRLPVREHQASRSSLYPHQAAMWEGWDRYPTMLLAAKTGTGKTRAAMLPVLKGRQWAVAAYPTNELLRDQVRAVTKFSKEEGIEPLVWTPQEWESRDRAKRYGQADHLLVPIDGNLLDQWQGVMHCKNRGETLRRLLDPDKPKILFTNPDILFLILGLQYHAEPFEALRRYETLILDEFHLYHGVELAHALIMVALARGFEIFRRLILLSATPHPEVAALLERALTPTVIASQLARGSESAATQQAEEANQTSIQSRTAVHGVELTPVQVTGGDSVEILLGHLVALKAELKRLRAEEGDDDYLPAVVIVNSVVNAIRLEDRLVESGFPRDCLAIIRGLSHRAIRDRRGKLLALGTSAIEVGVDFHCDILLFEASEAGSFLQRFGRVGRHRPGKAIALVPSNAFQGMSTLPSEIDRASFEDGIHAWYSSVDARPWFVTTEHGMITARALAENLLKTVEKDRNSKPLILTQLRQKIDTVLADHANRLGVSSQNLKAKAAFERCSARKTLSQWLNTYRRLNSFRTSLPSVKVHDFSEQHRRQDWEMGEYEADLSTLLKRAKDLRWNEKLAMMTIRGIGKYRRVFTSYPFAHDDCGQILETQKFPDLRLYQDGESTPISDLMGRKPHIFTVVPKSAVEEEIDWRLSVFEAGKYLIAFDGGALLLLELWKKQMAGKAGSQ
jgi:CRISPR-associated helicase Cas3